MIIILNSTHEIGHTDALKCLLSNEQTGVLNSTTEIGHTDACKCSPSNFQTGADKNSTEMDHTHAMKCSPDPRTNIPTDINGNKTFSNTSYFQVMC